MTVKCTKCQTDLTPTNIGYIHPISTVCDEDDGIRIDEQKRYLFEKKYGAPRVLPLDENKELKNNLRAQILDNEALTEINICLLSENAELIRKVEKCQKKLKQKPQNIMVEHQKWKPRFLRKNYSKA